VHAEQQERTFELKKIGQDVAELHRLIAQGQVDLAETGKTWSGALRSEVARIDNVAREMQERLSQGTQNAKKAFQELARRIDAIAQGEIEFAKDIRKDTRAHEEKLKLLHQELGEHTGSLMRCDMRAGTLLEAVQKVQEKLENNDQYLRSHLADELHRIDKVVEDHRLATSSAIQRHWKTMTADFTEVRAHVEGLKSSLEGERRERVQTAELLGSRVDATMKECSRWTVVTDRTKSLYSHKGLSPRS